MRVSQVGGREGDSFLSPEVQREKIEAWAAFRGWTITHWYVDLDVSGTGRVRRPEFERMMEAARDREFDAIAVYRLTRFARSVAGAASAYTELERLGVGLVSVTEDIDTTTVAGNFMRNILFALAEFESQRIGEEWRNVHASRRRRGIAHVARPTLGYRIDKGTITSVEPVEAEAVRNMYEWRAAGASYKAIRDRLHKAGYRPKRGGEFFAITSLHKTLRNPLYAGVVRTSDGELIEARHPAIVSRDLWDQVQALHQHTADTNRYRTGLLSGLLVCAGCGNRLQLTRRGRQRTYRCDAARYSTSCPSASSIDADRAEEHVERVAMARLREARMPNRGRLKATTQQAAWSRKSARLRARAEELTHALDQLSDQRFLKGTITAEEYDRQFVRYSTERAAATAEAEQLERMAAAARPLDRSALTVLSGAPVHVRRQAIGVIIDQVVVKPAPRRGRIAASEWERILEERLEIAWSELAA